MPPQVGAILTPSQREYLRGKSDIEEESDRERMTRSRIRSRIRAGVQDFALVLERLDLEDIKKAFETPAQDEVEVEYGLESMIALVYLFYMDIDKPGWVASEDLFEKRIESAIVLALNQVGESANNVDVGIEVARGDPLDDLLGKGIQELSLTELDQLHRAKKIDREAYVDEIIRRREGTLSSEAIESRDDTERQPARKNESEDINE